MPFIKKVISIFLVLVLVFNSCGLPVFYWVKIQLCKVKAEFAEMERQSSKTPTVFSSATKGLHREGSDELQVNGKMYDVVKTCVRNGIKYYYAVGDGDEDTYIHKLNEAEKGDTGTNSLPGKALKLYELKYVAVERDFVPASTLSDQITKICFNTAPLIYTSRFKDIFSPPPDHLFS